MHTWTYKRRLFLYMYCTTITLADHPASLFVYRSRFYKDTRPLIAIYTRKYETVCKKKSKEL